VAYGKNQHTAGVVFLNFFPTKNLTFSINSFFGNQALVNAAIDNDICYNNLIVQYSPVKHLDLTGQFDFAFETNIHLPPDTSKLSGMFSGFVMARYTFGEHVALTARYEFFNDPQGFLSGVYTYDDKMTGLATNGFTGGVEYKPVKFGYVRLEYRYLAAQKGNLVYSGNTSNTFQALTLTTGMRF
jgi:hypothetical protein